MLIFIVSLMCLLQLERTALDAVRCVAETMGHEQMNMYEWKTADSTGAFESSGIGCFGMNNHRSCQSSKPMTFIAFTHISVGYDLDINLFYNLLV